ncbi:hypothetical protein BJ138DRAFT_168455 [Hygrophoropsis aurantiaca]|uniref:Uncharacterized protein n=1 Tax=Hygrophoropsis aurantiaca TaxID=72124 RepID=A0ACB8A8T5_9AGAM|nr:hypothetical protein BJ138DRAFT_168455 [Hygrophoropsis aurantiaca]
MSTASPPRTPPIAPRIPSTSPSDDSSIIELSFDYEFDSAGNYVRVSKGSSGSSPPTPVELDNPRRHALSKSVTLDPVTVTGATAARSFQRVASGPAALTPAASAASARKLSRPQRIPLSIDEQPQDDWELRVQQDEKENILNIINSDSDNQQPPPQKRTSPHLTARSQPDGRAISALPTRAYSSSRQPLQPGRQILPGPNRAGRILMGVKYTPIDKINEHEQLDPGEETDTSPDEPISAAPGIARHRSYGAVVQPITRPRRSASLSDAGAGSLSESGGKCIFGAMKKKTLRLC